MAIDNIKNGMSIAGFGAALNEPRPDPNMYKPPERINVVEDRLSHLTELPTYRFPLDTPKYYLKMNIMEYSRAGLLQLGSMKQEGSIVLPLPLQLMDAHNVTYIQEKIGQGLGTGINAGVQGLNAIKDLMSSKSTLGQTAKSSQDFVEGLLKGGAAVAGQHLVEGADRFFGANISGAARAALGYSPNQFLTILLEGPTYKTFSMQWLLTPKNDEESMQINKIVRGINNAMAPSLALAGAIFQWPKVFNLELHPNSEMLMKFKPAVLQNFHVTYSGGGQMSMFRPSAKTKDQGAPESVSIMMNFLELEFWLAGDFKSNKDPKDVTGDRSGAKPLNW